MGKKYTPSGYLIVNLGKLNLSTSIQIQASNNDDVKALLEMYKSGNLKPVLLTVVDTESSGQVLSGFAYWGNELICLVCGGMSLTVLLYDTYVEVNYE